MPIYEYRCESCGKLFEQKQRITDDPLDRCVFCEGPVHRIVSRSTFILKGSGWYVTDYASKNRNSASASSGSEITPHSESTKSTETPAVSSSSSSDAKTSSATSSDSSTSEKKTETVASHAA